MATSARTTPAGRTRSGRLTQTNPALRYVAALCAGGLAAIHVLEFSEYYNEQPYIGVLFLVGAAALAYTTVALLLHRDTFAWLVGGLTALGMLVGGILSRTTGLPAFRDDKWDLLLLVSFGLEVAYLLAWAAREGRERRTAAV